MKITKLILKGYKRFDLLNIDTLTYTPDSPYQLILGVSGMGKTSLLAELSPLPCETEDLKEEGYKEIHLSHCEHHYILRYELHKKLTASFLYDGVELNDGGTIKVQKGLIQEHFQYDNTIHDLLIGQTKLSTMGPQERRSWFVNMSQADTTYALSVYNKLKSVERDISGAVKLNHQRLVAEQTRLPETEELDRCKGQSQQLKEELNHLLPFLDKQLMNRTGELVQLEEKMARHASLFIDSRFLLSHNGIKDVDVLRLKQQELINEKQQQQTRLMKIKDELFELQEVYTKHQQLTGLSLEEIDHQLSVLSKKMQSNLEQQEQLNINTGDNIQQQYQDFHDFITQLQDLISHTVVKEDHFTQENYQTWVEEREKCQRQKMVIGNKLSFYHQDLARLDKMHDVHCPNCRHQFKPGVECDQEEKIKASIEKGEQLLKEVENQIQQLTDKLTPMENYLQFKRRMKQFEENHTLFYPCFQYLKSFPAFQVDPRLALNSIHQYEIMLQHQLAYQDLLKSYDELDAQRVKRVAAQGVDVEYILNKMVKLEEETESLKSEEYRLTQEIEQFNRVISDHETARQYANELKQLMSRHEQLTLEQLRFENNQRVQQLVEAKQTKLAVNEAQLKQYTQSEVVIQQLEQTNEQLKLDQKALSLLTTLLSPKDGLIAESLLGFIHQFLEEMYSALDQIWVYSMRPHLSLDEEGVELDYRFKVDINNGASIVKDISRLSTGQKEVMDFIFKLLVMQHLGLQDYPLYMDEVGGNFDHHHRDRLYQYVKRLVESNQVQQVFIISHISTSHDALSNADKNVLDRDATMVDNTVNQYLQLN